jgi:Flp pilus assembly pilin Flp
MLRLMRKLWEDCSGPTAVEYGLICAVIVAVIIAGLTQVGTTLNHVNSNIATTVGS